MLLKVILLYTSLSQFIKESLRCVDPRKPFVYQSTLNFTIQQ